MEIHYSLFFHILEWHEHNIQHCQGKLALNVFYVKAFYGDFSCCIRKYTKLGKLHVPTLTNRDWFYCKNIIAGPFDLRSIAKAGSLLGPCLEKNLLSKKNLFSSFANRSQVKIMDLQLYFCNRTNSDSWGCYLYKSDVLPNTIL